MSDEKKPDYRHMLHRIGMLIEDTIPDPCEINTVDAVALLVRENTALRMALGLPTYKQLREVYDDAE